MTDVDPEIWDDVVSATLVQWLASGFEPCRCDRTLSGGRCSKHIEFLWRKRFKDDLVTQFVRSEPWLAKADRLRLRDLMVGALTSRGYPVLLANTSSSKARVSFPDGTSHRVTGIALGIRTRGEAAEEENVGQASQSAAAKELDSSLLSDSTACAASPDRIHDGMHYFEEGQPDAGALAPAPANASAFCTDDLLRAFSDSIAEDGAREPPVRARGGPPVVSERRRRAWRRPRAASWSWASSARARLLPAPAQSLPALTRARRAHGRAQAP